MNNKQVTGYKVTDKNMQCRGFQYEIGKVFEHEGYVSVCNKGFHFCEKAADCFNYYSFNSENRVFEVIAHGEIVTEGDKSATDKIEFVRELTWQEVLTIVNTGKDNTGLNNSGNSNSGNSNSGNSNSGNSNSGNRNSGYSNSGDGNSGNSNSGNSNSGNSNSGNRNSGNSNSGDWNSGYSNSGDGNSGNSNSGNSNSGNRNSGDWNSGNRNSGYSNSGDGNSGVFCTGVETLMFFNKPSKWTDRDFKESRAYSVMCRLETHIWVYSEDMTEAEKERYPGHVSTGGYLKEIGLKEAWINLWGNLNDEDKDSFKKLPNWNPKIFKEITGIEL